MWPGWDPACSQFTLHRPAGGGHRDDLYCIYCFFGQGQMGHCDDIPDGSIGDQRPGEPTYLPDGIYSCYIPGCHRRPDLPLYPRTVVWISVVCDARPDGVCCAKAVNADDPLRKYFVGGYQHLGRLGL